MENMGILGLMSPDHLSVHFTSTAVTVDEAVAKSQGSQTVADGLVTNCCSFGLQGRIGVVCFARTGRVFREFDFRARVGRLVNFDP